MRKEVEVIGIERTYREGGHVRPVRSDARMREQRRRAAKRRRRIQRMKAEALLAALVGLLWVLGRLAADSGMVSLSDLAFWDKTQNKGRDKVFEAAYEKEDSCLEALLEALEKNPELEDFVKGYPESDGSVTGGISQAELEQDTPLFLQFDKRWGYAAFGDDNIALSGCAPTCLSMVITALKKNADAPPDVIAAYCEEEGFYEKGVGTSWSLMTQGCLAFGVRGQELGLDEDVIKARLEAGEPVICSMRPGDFTTTGHFIVLTGVEEGKFRVNDPFSRERSEKLWEFDKIQYQIKNLWAFTLA